MLKGSKGKVSSKIQQGFTIIEVIIVLVIAAIIMLAVFLVVPQLQRTQRNTRRQADARQILAGAEQYASNNNGTYPLNSTGSADVVPSGITAITGVLNAPNGSAYTYGSATGSPGPNNLQYTLNAYTCSANAFTANTSAGKATIIIQLENSTTTPTYWCVGN